MYSRPLEDIVTEVDRLADNGYREVVLTGIHLGHYGVDWNVHKPKAAWTRLADLVLRLVELRGDFRIRLSSIEATEVTRELIAVMAQYPDRVCPHLHICLQSGSDRVLMQMKRGHTVLEYKHKIRQLREIRPDISISSDFIVGFPGESEDDFLATMKLIDNIGFRHHDNPLTDIHQFADIAGIGIGQKTIQGSAAQPFFNTGRSTEKIHIMPY